MVNVKSLKNRLQWRSARKLAKKMIPVSIGIPVYNGENYLEQAIDSILDQTFTRFELIIRDNASTDNTEGICQSYAARDSRIKYIRAKQNRGAAYNYNQVFHRASGKYFKWASHDDLLDRTNIENCYEYLKSNPTVVLCYPKTTIIDKDGNPIEQYHDEMDLMDTDPVDRLTKLWTRSARECNAVFGLIRSDVLRKTRLIEPFNESDNILLAHLILLGQFKELPGLLFFRRDHEYTSLKANRTAKDVSAWFDPSTTGMVLPECRLTIEYLKTIISLELDPGTKFRILMLWGRRTWSRRRKCYREIRGR